MPQLRTAVPLLALLLLLTGCGGASGADEAGGERKGQLRADEHIYEQADELAGDLRGVAWLEEAAYLELQVPLESRDQATELKRVLLVSESSSADDGETVFHLVTRIWVHVTPDNSADWFPMGEATVARCFAYDVRRDDEVAPSETECPDSDPIQVDTTVQVPRQPSVLPEDEAAIRAFLRRGGVAADLQQLQASLSPDLTARVVGEDGVTAVAVTAQPDGVECVLARRGPGSGVHVWHPDRMHTMAGEMGCVPELVLHPPV